MNQAHPLEHRHAGIQGADNSKPLCMDLQLYAKQSPWCLREGCPALEMLYQPLHRLLTMLSKECMPTVRARARPICIVHKKFKKQACASPSFRIAQRTSSQNARSASLHCATSPKEISEALPYGGI